MGGIPFRNMSAFRYLLVLAFVFAFRAIDAISQTGVVSVIDAAIDSLEGGVRREPVDSAYLREVELLLEQEEKKQNARLAIKITEDKLLNEEMSFRFDGSLQLMRGVLMAFAEDDFAKRPGVFKHYDWDLQDYGVAAAPLAASWLLKASGVESRSTTRRMVTSNAIALALSAGLVKILKLSFDKTRPDGEGDDSFPSGHSSLAFVGATVLHREFGHHSPWISVGGYTTATAAQLLRFKHNRHWAHDTFIGASIGVVSTNLAYFIADKIYGAGGVNRPRYTYADLKRVLDYNTQPSALAFVSGTEMGGKVVEQSSLTLPASFSDKAKVHVTAGFMAGLEGSWFISPNVAFDAMFKYTTSKAKLSLSGTMLPSNAVLGANLDFYRFSLGVRYSYLLAMSHRFSFRLFAGTRINDTLRFDLMNEGGLASFRLPADADFDSGVSIMYDCISTEKYSYGFNFDYHHTDSDVMPHRYGLSAVWKILL